MKPLVIFILLFLPLLAPQFFSSELSVPTALFLTVVILWFTELLPLPVTGLLVPVLASLYGILPAKESFQAFGSDILFLFIGCFLMARAMQKHGWDRRMAYWVLSSRMSSGSPTRVITAVALISCFFSMGISNTATCAMMIPICLGLISVYSDQFNNALDRENFAKRLLLTTAFASTMGGLATPIGTPPNLIALEFLHQEGISISFFEWFGIGAPLSFVMMISLLVVFRFVFPLSPIQTSGVRDLFRRKLSELGPLKREELQVAGVFSLAVFLWVIPGILENVYPDSEIVQYLVQTLTISVVGLGAALPLFILKTHQAEANLSWEDASSIDWGTILLFGGGLTLGKMLDVTGVAASVGELVFSPSLSPLLLLMVAAGISLLMSEFASNTASASVVVPIILASVLLPNLGSWGNSAIVLASSFGASFGFMLPVSTPPNALVFGTGKVPLRDMIRAGIIFDLLGIVIIVSWMYLLVNWNS